MTMTNSGGLGFTRGESPAAWEELFARPIESCSVALMAQNGTYRYEYEFVKTILTENNGQRFYTFSLTRTSTVNGYAGEKVRISSTSYPEDMFIAAVDPCSLVQAAVDSLRGACNRDINTLSALASSPSNTQPPPPYFTHSAPVSNPPSVDPAYSFSSSTSHRPSRVRLSGNVRNIDFGGPGSYAPLQVEVEHAPSTAIRGRTLDQMIVDDLVNFSSASPSVTQTSTNGNGISFSLDDIERMSNAMSANVDSAAREITRLERLLALRGAFAQCLLQGKFYR